MFGWIDLMTIQGDAKVEFNAKKIPFLLKVSGIGIL